MGPHGTWSAWGHTGHTGPCGTAWGSRAGTWGSRGGWRLACARSSLSRVTCGSHVGHMGVTWVAPRLREELLEPRARRNLHEGRVRLVQQLVFKGADAAADEGAVVEL
eukprot:2082518-Prymnesium_polylepis.1